VIVVSLLLRLALYRWLGNSVPYLQFFPAIFVAARYGGRLAAVITTLLSALAAGFFLLSPTGSFQVLSIPDLVSLPLFILVGVAIAEMNESLRRTAFEAEAATARAEHAAREARRNERRLAELVADVPGVVWEAWGQPDAREQRIDFVSEHVESMLQYSQREWLATPNFWLTIVHPDDRERAAREAAEIFGSDQGAGSSEFRWITKDGRAIWVEARSRVIRDERGRPIGMRGVTMDIARRRQLEDERATLLAQAQQLNRLKDEFLATLSHELRTPINAVLGWAQMLRRGMLPAERVPTAMDAIERNAAAQQRLIDELLDLSQVITGKFRLRVEEIEFEPLVHAAVASMKPAADAKSIRLDVVVDNEIGVSRGDPHRLQQAIWNLLSNAVKFTPEHGSVRVTVRRDARHVVVGVIDNGEGIDRTVLPYIFDRFRQADSTTTRAHSGLGLGLAIVRYIVELHGGTVTAESAGPGTGSRFTMVLPISPVVSPAPPPPPLREPRYAADQPDTAALPRLDGVHVLVVDDDGDARRMMAELLAQQGAEVAMAAGADEAIIAFEAKRPHVLLADIEMPGRDGFQLLREIRGREQRSAAAPVPAAAVTAHARPADRERALEEGFQTHLSKPIEIRSLVSAIRSLVPESRTVLLIALACLLRVAPAAAQPQMAAQDLKRLSIEELTQVDITTASRRAEPLAQVAAAVSVIRGEDIRRAGVTTLAEALRLADGIAVARADASTWAISARGFNIPTANKLLVLIDGRTVYSPLFAGTFWSVQDVPLANIDRIEVTRGPGGTIWGANAVNGVVNIITKRAADTRGGQVLLGAGDEERAIATAQYGGARGGIDYRVYGKFRYRDAHVIAGGIDANDPARSAQTGVRVESNGQGRDAWLVQGDAYVGREGLFDRPDTHVNGGYVMGRWTRRFSAAAELRTQVYYDHVYRRVFQQLRDARDTVDLDIQQRLLLAARHDLLFGGSVRVSRGDDSGNAAFFFDPQVAVTTLAGTFVQDEIAVVPRRLVLIGGVKFERNTFTGLETQPSVRVRWTPEPSRTVWAAVSRAVRLPTRFDTDLRFTNPASGAVTLRGGRDFQSEHVVAYEAGYRMQWRDRASADLAAFTNTYGDLRSQEFPTGAGQPVRLRNLLNARTAGGELAGTASVLRTWRVHAAYTYLHERFTLDPGSRDPTRGFSEFNDPTHMVSLRSNADLPRGFELDAMFRHIGRLPHPAVAAYSELDARIGWRPRAAAWDVSFVGQNLLHAHHPEFPLAGPTREEFERGFYVRTSWRF
jgi:iron complex outermembrane receptor protein